MLICPPVTEALGGVLAAGEREGERKSSAVVSEKGAHGLIFVISARPSFFAPCGGPPPVPPLLSTSPRQAFSADAILVCAGEPAYAEKPGDITELELPRGISEFVKELRKVSDDTTPIVLALVEGRPRLLGDLPRTVRSGGVRGGG